MKILNVLVILAVVLVSIPVFGYGSNYYDNSGNTYYRSGSTLNGYNSNTGSQWRTNYNSDGSSSGTDSHGNYWQKDSNNNYHNYGTGKSCYGVGEYRTCY